MPAREDMYDGDTPQPAPPAQNAPLTDWTTVKSGSSASKATRICSNPRSPAAAR